MTKPNIVLVVMDTARAADAAPSRHQEGALPAINRLAAEGTEYTHAFANAPWTLPSHASLFTGTYPSKHGAHAGHKHLDADLPTIAECFQSSGYETTAVSNNTWISEEFGFARGFDTLYKTWQYVQSDTDLGEVAQTTEGMEMFRALATRLSEGNPLTNIVNAIYGKFLRKRTDDGAQRTNRWISRWLDDRDRTTPFFLFVNYLEPHLQYDPPEAIAEQFLPTGVSYHDAMEVSQDAWGYIAGDVELIERDFETLRALYRAEIAYLDERIGELKVELEAANEWENTIFVVTSDHGENIGDHGLMDHQYSLHDTLLDVPLVIHGGAFNNQGAVGDMVQLTDLAPTLLDAAEIDVPKARAKFQGQSFHPKAETTPRERVIAEYMAPQPSMDALEKRIGALPQGVRKYDRSLRTIRTADHKLIYGSDGSRKLYAIGDDPWENQNIAEDYPEQVTALETELDAWLDSFEHADTAGTTSMTNATERRLEDLGYLQ